MAGANDFTGKFISSTYQRVLQLSGSGQITDGTGSLISFLPITVSRSETASYVPGITVFDTSSLVTKASFYAFTSSYNTGSFTGSFTGSLFGEASYANSAGIAGLATSVSVINLIYTDTPTPTPTVPLPLLTTQREGGYETNGYTGVYEQSNILISNTNVLTLTGSGAQLRIGYEAPVPLEFPPPPFYGTVQVLGNVYADSYTGSLQGTASYVTGSIFTSANPALSASFALSSSFAVSSSFARSAITASYLPPGTYAITSSWANSSSMSVSSSFSISSSRVLIRDYDDILNSNIKYPFLLSPVSNSKNEYLSPYENTQFLFEPQKNTLYHTGSSAKVIIGNSGSSNARLTVYGKVSALAFDVFTNTFNFVSDISRDDSTVASLSIVNNNMFLSGSSYSGSFSGSLFGSASYALTASYAMNAGDSSINTGSLVTTSSFNSFTASYTTGSFTGSFLGTATTASYAIFNPYIVTIGTRIYTDDTFITAGFKGYKHVGYNANIIKTRTIANTSGSIDINVKRSGTTLGTISLSNQSASLDTTLAGWTTQLNTDDLLEFHVSQSSTYITDISIFIDIQARQ